MKQLSIITALLLPAFAFATPYAPSDLTFTDVTENAITLNWQDNSGDETGFKIYKDGKFLIKTNPDVESYTVSGLISDANYTIEVKATDDSYQYNEGIPLTREELQELLKDYDENPTQENKRAIERANTSQIIDMSYIFYLDAHHKNRVKFDGDISGWDTSNVTTMRGMFEYSNINIPESFNTSKAIDMFAMFAYSKIEELPDSFSIPIGVNAQTMFAYSKIKKLPKNFDISNTSNSSYIFNSCDISLPEDFDTSKVTNFNQMFFRWEKENIPNINTSRATKMYGMFQSSKITKLPDTFDTSNVTDMRDMFYNTKITTLPTIFDTSNVTNMENMFQYSTIETLPESFNTSNVTNMHNMFYDSSINHIPQFNTYKVTNMIGMFKDCKNFNQDVSSWDVSKVDIQYYEGYEFKQWAGFNENSSLEDAHIPPKFRDD